MDKFIVKESPSLNGEVTISGAKNSILPILCATILTDEEVTLFDVPPLSDVFVMSDILKVLGKQIDYDENTQTIKIKGKVKTDYVLEESLVSKIRASFLVAGALLSKNKFAKVPHPGGCEIGQRPIDLHLKGFNRLNAVTKIESGITVITTEELIGNTIYLDFPSVGATENIILASVFAKGITIIENPAVEPEISDLCTFLNKMGANIKGSGTDTIKIHGVEKLTSVTHKVIPDRIEAGTFMIGTALASGDVTIKNVVLEHLKPVTLKLREMNVTVYENDDEVRVISDNKNLIKTDIKTMPYPGFPTDLQSPFLTLLTKAKGTSVVTESIFENRFMIAKELEKMGANIKIESKVSIIDGVDTLEGAKVHATDLRGGASLILAGLIAKGETEISDIYHIERGYHNIEEKFRKLGANIEKVKDWYFLNFSRKLYNNMLKLYNNFIFCTSEVTHEKFRKS